MKIGYIRISIVDQNMARQEALMELMGLRWENFDTDAGILHIRQGLTAYCNLDDQSWTLEAQGLKNKYRRRSIPIIDPDLLQRLREKPQEITITSRCSAVKGTVVRTEYIFHSPEGQPYQPHNWGHRVYNRFMEDMAA